MNLNDLKPAAGSRRKPTRVGRGIGSGLGKTCGRGIKGAGARKSAHKRPGFDGGQMPMKIRLPKFGFWSKKATLTTDVPLNSLNSVEGDVIDLEALRKARLVTKKIKYVKIVLSKVPSFNKKVTVKGLGVTRGAKAAIEAAGGTIEEADYIKAAAERRAASEKRSAAKSKARIDAVIKAGVKKPAKKAKAEKKAD